MFGVTDVFLFVFRDDAINEPPPKPSVTSNNVIESNTLTPPLSFSKSVLVPVIADASIIGL